MLMASKRVTKREVEKLARDVLGPTAFVVGQSLVKGRQRFFVAKVYADPRHGRLIIDVEDSSAEMAWLDVRSQLFELDASRKEARDELHGHVDAIERLVDAGVVDSARAVQALKILLQSLEE